MTVSTIVKICPYHGSLTLDQVNKNTSRKTCSFRCKQCQKDAHQRYYAKNKEKVLKDCAKYREENYDFYLESKRRSRLKTYSLNAKKYRERNKAWRQANKLHDTIESRKRKSRARANLSDGYVKQSIKKVWKFKLNEIPKEVIEIKRAMLKIERLRKLGATNEQNQKHDADARTRA